MIKEQIKKIIKKTISQEVDFSVEVPTNKNFGDYSTNVAMMLKKNPDEIAEKIKSDLFKKIEVKNGFINFFISDKYFIDNLKNINKDYGKNKELKNKKIVIDYTDPNPFKEFHIGHLMSNAIGESISRILEFQGAKVKRVCFQGDIGIHVAKAVWDLKNKGIYYPTPQLSATAYAVGSEMYKTSKDIEKEINKINKKIYDRSDRDINKIYDEGKKASLKYFDKIYKMLNTEFNDLIFESQVIDLGKKIVEKGLKNGIFEKGEGGAIIFRGEKYGLHTRVFINSDGLPTYEAKDLGLAELKYKKYKYDESVVVTANEQNSHFAVMLCALDKINKELAERTKHISHGILKLPEGKMSSRTGNVITGESLIEKIKELVSQRIKDKELSEIEKSEISEAVAIGAIKYSILKQSIGSDIIYDFDRSISFDGDSGPYLQYSYARAKSVLKKAKQEGIKPNFKKTPDHVGRLEKKIVLFSDAVLQADKSLDPHFIALYLSELASEFNSYYTKNKIVSRNDEFSAYKVAITEKFAIIMENGLWLLGIRPLEKM
jgi:arginyl-tRNA synthetase